MKYIKQFGIIVVISFIGEVLNRAIPLPIPASIYGLVLMFLCLQLKLFPVEAVRDVGMFLIEIMPLMFIPSAVGLMESWGIIKPSWPSYILITVISTFAVMAVSGAVTQAVIRHSGKRDEK